MAIGELIKDLGVLARKSFGNLYVSMSPRNETLLDIFDDEVEKAGLQSLGINLLIPKLPDEYPYNNKDYGYSRKMGDDYFVTVAIPPEGLKGHEKKSIFHYHHDDEVDSYLGQFRVIVRHELGHIKMGHLSIPKPFSKVYYHLVGEMAAELYAAFAYNERTSFLFKKIF